MLILKKTKIARVIIEFPEKFIKIKRFNFFLPITKLNKKNTNNSTQQIPKVLPQRDCNAALTCVSTCTDMGHSRHCKCNMQSIFNGIVNVSGWSRWGITWQSNK